jgi:asparagine synthase (glutamine-hydrolysing)
MNDSKQCKTPVITRRWAEDGSAIMSLFVSAADDLTFWSSNTMSGLCGICDPGLELSAALLTPMLNTIMSAEDSSTDVDNQKGALLGVASHSTLQQTAGLPDLSLAIDGYLHNCDELVRLADEPANTELNSAQIVLGLYRKEGLDFLQRLEGSFALALWDAREQRLVLGIDRMGIKGLYWRCEGGRLLFATRLGAIRAVQGELPRISMAALMQYLLFAAVPAPLTIDNGSHKMAPGHVLVFERGQMRQSRYWDLRYEEEHGRSTASWAEELREALRSAVHRHLTNCDLRVTGCFLSGGTDSSTVTAFASERISPVPTFTINFNDPAYSEIEFARAAASRFRARRIEECLLPSSAFDSIPRIIAAYDEPFGNSSVLPTYACAKLARDHGIEVLLAADGGDELFAGNDSYLRDKYLQSYHMVPGWARSALLNPLARLLPEGGTFGLPRRFVRRAGLPNPRRFLSYGYFLSTPPETIFEPTFLSEVPPDTWLNIAEQHFRSATATNDLNRSLYLDMKMTLADNDLRKVVGTADSLGIQVRFPLLDYHLAELSARIPASLKLRGFELRYIFKCAMKDILPKQVLFKKKHGFGVPIGSWLRSDPGMNALMLDLLRSQKLALREYFRPNFFDRLIEEHARALSSVFHGQILWRLMVFELWRRDALRKEVAGSPLLRSPV